MRKLYSIFLATTLVGAFACSQAGSHGPTTSVNGDGGNGDGGNGNGNGNGDGGIGGGDVDMLPDPCSDEAKLVYVVDENKTLSSFKPSTLAFADLGTLNCPTSDPTSTPFSMGIDRTPSAWVLYNSGELFHVTFSPLTCTKTTFSSTQYVNFGMGFVSNSPGSVDETLFIGGGPQGVGSGTSYLGTLNVAATPPTAMRLSQLAGWPEMSGTGDSKLWGFYPQTSAATTPPPRVVQIDKASATESNTISLAGNMGFIGAARAWAFAQWGGDFWIFLKRQSGDPSTNVWQVKGTPDHTVSKVVPNTGRTIVGAGVSTCAPYVAGPIR